MGHWKHGVTSGKGSLEIGSPQGVGQPGTRLQGDGEEPHASEILDTSPCVPQPLWSCGGTAQSPHMLPPAPSGFLCASVPVPGHSVVPISSCHSLGSSLSLGYPPPIRCPSPLRSLFSPGVLITPGVFTIPQGPHYFLESLSPSVSLLSLGSPSLQDPHHPRCPVVPLSPSPLGFPTPLG